MLQYAKEGTVKKSFDSYYFLMISPERCRVASRRNLKYLFDKDTKILLVFRYEGAAIPNQIGWIFGDSQKGGGGVFSNLNFIVDLFVIKM